MSKVRFEKVVEVEDNVAENSAPRVEHLCPRTGKFEEMLEHDSDCGEMEGSFACDVCEEEVVLSYDWVATYTWWRKDEVRS